MLAIDESSIIWECIRKIKNEFDANDIDYADEEMGFVIEILKEYKSEVDTLAEQEWASWSKVNDYTNEKKENLDSIMFSSMWVDKITIEEQKDYSNEQRRETATERMDIA